MALAVALAGALAVAGCSGDDGDGDETDDYGDAEPEAAAVLVGPDDFAARMDDPDAFVVNVHIPYEGEIDGTDAFIPFDEIEGDDRLPEDRDTEILLYCKSGRMSAEAAQTLLDESYTDVVDLDGGMNAWEDSGRELIDRPR